MTSVFVAEWPDGQVTRMSVHGNCDLARAVRVSWHAYDSRLKGRASRNITIKSARFFEQPDKAFNDLDVDSFFRLNANGDEARDGAVRKKGRI